MFKILLALVIVAVLVLLSYAATQPDSFRVERTVQINASAETLFPLVNDLHRFNTWNPYAKKDPDIQGRYGDTGSGPGAFYSWKSDKVGVGRMEITNSTPFSQVTMKLDFIKPFQAHNIAEFVLIPKGESTQVIWTMHGPAPFLSKLMQVFISMDKMIGKDFENGLRDLKVLAEKH